MNITIDDIGDMFPKHIAKLTKAAGTKNCLIRDVYVNGFVFQVTFGTSKQWADLFDGIKPMIEGDTEAYESARFELLKPYDCTCLTLKFFFVISDDAGQPINYTSITYDNATSLKSHSFIRKHRSEAMSMLAKQFGLSVKNIKPISFSEFEALEKKSDYTVNVSKDEIVIS